MAKRSRPFLRATCRSAFWLLLLMVLGNTEGLAVSSGLTSKNDFDSCNWLVTYRNRTYDLSPLAKPGLDRPVEGDLRSVLARIPAAAAHLENVSQQAKAARVHSIIGTASIMVLVGTRIAYKNAKDKGRSDNTRLTLDVASLISGLFFVKATYDSERATQSSKEELIEAVRAFNARSPYKIEPARKGGS